MFRFATESLRSSPASAENGKTLPSLQVPAIRRGDTVLKIRARGQVELVMATSPENRTRVVRIGGGL